MHANDQDGLALRERQAKTIILVKDTTLLAVNIIFDNNNNFVALYKNYPVNRERSGKVMNKPSSSIVN